MFFFCSKEVKRSETHFRPRGGRIEDEYQLRMHAADMFAAPGFEIVQTVNANHAIAIPESNPGHCHGFIDIRMPDVMDGLKLALASDQQCRPLDHWRARETELARGTSVSANALQTDVVTGFPRELTTYAATLSQLKP
jgi:hypothetical protein